VSVAVSPTEQGRVVSFVNSIWTSRGGTHVAHAVKQLHAKIASAVGRKLKPAQIRPYLHVVVRALVHNPSFDTQTKECLTLDEAGFGLTCKLPAAFLRDVAKSGVVELVRSRHESDASRMLSRQNAPARMASRVSVPKLEDANHAGTRRAKHCTLILTEGDSAKALAVAGLSVVGRDRYGVFPLRGKLLNVRDATNAQVLKNKEIGNLMTILGLRHGVDYADPAERKRLRYGHVMLMCDQDHDGSHIKGLIQNLFHRFFPALLRVPGFLLEFSTYIVVATRRGHERRTFFSEQELHTWASSLPADELARWKQKYYKGLATSTNAEAKQYFSELDTHVFPYAYTDEADDDVIDLAFRKSRTDDRKRLINERDVDAYVDRSVATIPYGDFVRKELVHFWNADLERSIPDFCDGLKPGLRKIVYLCLRKNITDEIKVAQLAAKVAEEMSYHHGEQSLATSIVGLAQDYVGKNNVNLLEPLGQFGSRHMNGKDAGSPRYIFTQLAPEARLVFCANDDRLLEPQHEDGAAIEPVRLLPCVPMLLINGGEGIGTGWSTSVPAYAARDVSANVRRALAGERLVPMLPCARGHTCRIEPVPGKTVETSLQETHPALVPAGGAAVPATYAVSGRAAVSADGRVVTVTELPLGLATQTYKERLAAWEEEVKQHDAWARRQTRKRKREADEGDGGSDEESAAKRGKGNDGESKAKKTKAAKKKAASGGKKGAKDPEPKRTGPHVVKVDEKHTDRAVHFVVQLAEPLEPDERTEKALLRSFKLTGNITTSNMHAFDAEQRIRRYTDPLALVADFVDFRRPQYTRRRALMLEELERESRFLRNEVRFMRGVMTWSRMNFDPAHRDLAKDAWKTHAEALDTRGVPTAELVAVLEARGYDRKPAAKGGDTYGYLLGMSVMTAEKIAKKETALAALDARRAELEATTPEAMWRAELDAFDAGVAEHDAAWAAE
jgi:DNA topoisomerase-2